MAKIPTPRSYNRTLGDMINAFVGRVGVDRLQTGNPILSLLEAAAMSDMRSSQAIFDLLAADSLDRAEGDALLREGAKDGLVPYAESSASGTVTITDGRIQKISSKVYQGTPAPIANSGTINVQDADVGWPASGSIYIGRGTSNVEGPLEYVSKTNSGGYWTITLKPGHYTKKYHNVGESVVLAQNGNRLISPGVIVQTPQGALTSPTQFAVLYPATIPDGETVVEGVTVVAQLPGTNSNVAFGAINSFPSPPFPGATVTNPLPFTNGRDNESELDFKERIRKERQSKAKGTALAIETAVLGITSNQDNKRVTSAAVVNRLGQTSLFIDDGTGYEESSEGVAIESLADAGLGGETQIQLANRPIAQAFVETTSAAPFLLHEGDSLAVAVGGIRSEHVFSSGEFRNITNATAHEVVASINGNPNIGFYARTSSGGTRVVLFSRTEQNEDIEVLNADDSTADANDALDFPAGKRYTIRLYKNDVLLSKDGSLAVLRSSPFVEWGALSGTETLTISVDGTPAQTYSFSSADFVAAGTGFSTMGNHTGTAWAQVLNYKIPGISAVFSGGVLQITSNLGRSARSALSVTGGSLLSKGVFSVQSTQGSDRDFTLDRNTGVISLVKPLTLGDRLAAGTSNTRAFIQSETIAPVTLASSGKMFVSVDGQGAKVHTGITVADLFSVTQSVLSGKTRYTITALSGAPFQGVAVGDFLIISDSAADWAPYQGVWYVVACNSTAISFDAISGKTLPVSVNFDDAGIAVVRTATKIQEITIPAASNYTSASLAAAIAGVGLKASTYQNSKLRLQTKSFSSAGGIGLIATDKNGAKSLLPVGSETANKDAHLASAMSEHREIGTPSFESLTVQASSSASSLDLATNVSPGALVVGLKGASGSNNSLHTSPIHSVIDGVNDTVSLRDAAPQRWLSDDRVFLSSPFSLGPEDSLTVVADQDADTKRFSPALWRALRPVGTTYGATNAYQDIGDGTQSATTLANAFGMTYSFDDHSVFMRARTKTHEGTAPKSVLWRFKRFGAEGERTRIQYVYPAAPSQTTRVTVDPMPSGSPDLADISLVLPSGVRKSGATIRNSTMVGYDYNAASTLGRATLILGFAITGATRVANTVTLTLALPAGLYNVSAHGIAAGQNIWVQSSNPSFPSGVKNIVTANATQITYTEVLADASAGAIGTISYDPAGPTSFGTISPALVVGDLVRLDDFYGIPAHMRGQTIRVTAVGPQFLQGYTERNETGAPSIIWANLVDANRISFYSLDAANCTASAIVAAVNALDNRCPIRGTLLGDGTGAVLLSSREEAQSLTPHAQLKDGLNWVKTTTLPLTSVDNYSMEFKKSVDAGLVSGSDWGNEEVRVVPLTTKAVAAWLNSLSVSGMASNCSVDATARGHLQIASNTNGSAGAVDVQGGTANAALAALVGPAIASGSYALATVRTADLAGFHAGDWVGLSNTVKLPKLRPVTGAILNTLTTDGHFSFDNGSFSGLYTVLGSVVQATVRVEEQGRFVAISGFSAAAAAENDYVWITAPTVNTSPISAANHGVYRIVRANASGVWIESDGAVFEDNKQCDIKLLSANSIVPGDTVTISTDMWGNKGTFEVEHVGDPLNPLFSDPYQMTVRLADGISMTAVVSPTTALSTTEAQKIVFTEGKYGRLIKKIHCIVPHQSDVNLSLVKFSTAQGSSQMTGAAGCVMAALDKLNFSKGVVQGADGYQHNTGLLAEANRVVYGVARDYQSYPPVIAAGASVNISGPLVKRIQVSLSVRTRLGINKTDISAKVRSALASQINRTGIGEPVAISDLITAASRVNGVLSVSVLSPTFNSTNDLINVQPYEKPLVINIDQDVSVSFVGE